MPENRDSLDTRFGGVRETTITGQPVGLCWVTKLSPAMFGIVVGLGVLTTALLSCWLIYSRSHLAVREEIRGNIRRIAKVASAVVDPELHQTFKSPEQETSAKYAEAVLPLQRFVESDPGIIYVYTCVMSGGKVRFVLDPTPAGDRDGDGVDDKSHIMQQYEDPSPEMLSAFEYQASTADSQPYTDIWGTFVSGYAPIFDEHGDMVAVIGVDMLGDRFESRLAGVRQALFIAAGLAFVLSFLVGLAGSGFQRRRQQWMLQEAAAKCALRDSADSLDVANARLRFSSNRFESLFSLIPVACFTFDRNGTIFEVNDECERLIGVKIHKLIQKPIFKAIVSGSNHELFQSVIDDVFNDVPRLGVEWSDVSQDGRKFTVVLNAFPLYSHEGLITGGVAACSDVTSLKELQAKNQQQIDEIKATNCELQSSQTELSKANERLQHLATTDGLTGVPNKTAIVEALSREMSTSSRESRPLSVLMLDIDKFKVLNDTHGHVAGDAVLLSVANKLKAILRAGDWLGRFGGEEFMVVLPNSDAEAAMAIAERFRRSIATGSESEISVSISIGVSTLERGTQSETELIDSADKALYHAKRTGRNRVVHNRDLSSAA